MSGVETAAVAHTAIREDGSIELAREVLIVVGVRHGELDLVL